MDKLNLSEHIEEEKQVENLALENLALEPNEEQERLERERLEREKPIRTNITFSDIQIGGLANDILTSLSIKNYTWLKTDNNIFFKLNTKNTKKKVNLRYLDKGNYTAVFGIELIEDRDNKKNWEDKYNTNLILRVTTEDSKNIIATYNKDKPIFTHNLIDIFLYGELKTATRHIGYYSITREYQTNFKLLNITNKIKVIKDYFKVIVKASENNIFYRDQKYANIGYEIVGDDCKFIILDYDDVTLLNINEWIIAHNFPFIPPTHYFFGTYPPNYMINPSLFNPRIIRESMFDKLYVGGMLNILNDIIDFYTPISNFMLEVIFPSMSSRLNITKHTEIIIRQINMNYKPNTADNKKSINLATLLIDKENGITELYKYFLKNIILKCLELNYKDVLTIDEIKQYIIYIDDIFLNLLCKIEDPIIKDQIETNPMFNIFFKVEPDHVIHGGYKYKYLKYKEKYLKLKKILN